MVHKCNQTERHRHTIEKLILKATKSLPVNVFDTINGNWMVPYAHPLKSWLWGKCYGDLVIAFIEDA